MSIQHWPVSERPRERLLSQGAPSLSDAELLAIFLRTGIKGKSAVDLAREILASHGSLQALNRISEQEFCSIPGLGPAKYCQFKAVLEMASRCLGGELKENTQSLHHPQLLEQFVRLQIGLATIEKFLVIGMDNQLQVLAHAVLASGTVNKTAVYPREVVKFAITHNATRMMIAHNHPSGHCIPSAADDSLTLTLKKALNLLDIELVDHLIVSHARSYSYRLEQRAPFD
ncbi:MAG: DNA repair protein RadC [Limnobacter sp.]|nr:DNA repair protein RadC [Limnobacter sp.]